MRVLKWMIDRCEGRGGANESPIGYIPRAEDLDTEGLDGVSAETMTELLSVKEADWKKELAGQQEFFGTMEQFLPPELNAQREKVAAHFAHSAAG